MRLFTRVRDYVGTVYRVRREKGLRRKLEKLQHTMLEKEKIRLERRL